MWNFIKKYWDLFGGAVVGVLLCIIAHIRLERVQLLYSIIILFLCSIGLFRTIKQAIEANKRERRIIDSIIDSQLAIKAVSIAEMPTKEGEKIGKIFIVIMEASKNIMEKIKQFFSKFKGYMLTIALAILSAVEMCGGVINSLCGGVFTINGVEVLPVVTLACTAVVGIVSNGYTKEQRDKIKALFSKSSTEELVKAEIKKTLASNNTKLAETKRELATKHTELANLEAELERNKNTHAAKKAMYGMVPQLATADDVQNAANEVVNTEAKIVNKKAEIEKTKIAIETLETTIGALKTQMKAVE